MTDYVLSAPPALVVMTPFGMWHISNDYLTSGDLFPTDRFSVVPYFLYCQSLELGLKGFLFYHGVPEQDLIKKYGHSLIKALAEARARGLDAHVAVSPADDQLVEELNPYYAEG